MSKFEDGAFCELTDTQKKTASLKSDRAVADELLECVGRFCRFGT